MCKAKKTIRNQEEIIYIERKEAYHSVKGNKLRALYYRLLLLWYNK